MPYMSEETYANKSVYFDEHYYKTNLSHTLNYEAVSCQDKESTDHSFQNPVIERVPTIGDNIYTHLWKVTENRVRFEDEKYNSKGVLRESRRSNDFLEKVNILKQKLNIIDDYKVNTEIYEKAKHLIDVDSLEVQTRKSPCRTPTKQNKRNIIDERHFKFQPTRPLFILGKDQKQEANIRPLKVDSSNSLSASSEKCLKPYTQIHEEFKDFTNSGGDSQSQRVSVVIENTRTPTRSENNIFRNVLIEAKFDPDSIDGIQLDKTDTQDDLLNILLKQEKNSLVKQENGWIEEGNYYDTVDNTETISVDIENNAEENESLDQVNDGTSSDPTFLSCETSSTDETGVDEQMSEPDLKPEEIESVVEATEKTCIKNQGDSEVGILNLPIYKSTPVKNGNLVKFKAKSFLKTKLNMKENEILQVLKEVKEIDSIAKKLNKTSYDLTTPDTSGISSSHSLIESSTPGRENWRLRESDRSKSSSSSCKLKPNCLIHATCFLLFTFR
uniref:Uncharacterized protein n=1 Tax=Cacopsylla melanoneura TaxID=428564 RepID=A0A8D8ZBT5_9HEMI